MYTGYETFIQQVLFWNITHSYSINVKNVKYTVLFREWSAFSLSLLDLHKSFSVLCDVGWCYCVCFVLDELLCCFMALYYTIQCGIDVRLSEK